MSHGKKRRISGLFTSIAANAALAAGATGCAHHEWQGNPGLGQPYKVDPLLDHSGITVEPVTIEETEATQNGGISLALDKILHGGDHRIEAERITYTSSDGTQAEAYLTMPRYRDDEKPLPAVVVFPVLSEKQSVSELFSKHLTRNGFAVLRMTAHAVELVDTDNIEGPMSAYRHAILDARTLIDWMQEHRAEGIDGDRIGAAGVSLGSLMSSTLMGVEPDIRAGAFVLSGGDLAEIFSDSTNETIESFRAKLSARENITTREQMIEHLRPHTDPMDPLTYAGSVDPCRVLMITGRNDTSIPTANSEKLWEEFGQPDWRTMPTQHKNIAWLFHWIIGRVADHFDEVMTDGVCDNRPDMRRTANDDTDSAGADLPMLNVRRMRNAPTP